MTGPGSKRSRPVLDLPLTGRDWALEAVSVVGVLFAFIVVIAAWESLPDTMPNHFGPSGVPDGWGGKSSLAFLPAVMVGLYLLLSVVSRYPHTFNYLAEITERNAPYQYRVAREMLLVLKVEIAWTFAYIEWQMVEAASGSVAGLSPLFLPVFVLVTLGTVVLYVVRLARRD